MLRGENPWNPKLRSWELDLKVLFIASNPPDAVTLNLEREITELQRRFAEAPGEPISFAFLPGLRAEDLPGELAKRRPDILHISAHGSDEQLSLTNEAGKKVALNGDALAAFLPPEHKPRLIYLNACDSHAIAKQLTNYIPMAIGTTAPITNRAARAGAVSFYERILTGSTVGNAFGVVKQMVQMLQDQQASSELHARQGTDPEMEVLHLVPRLIADFLNGDPKPKRQEYSVRLGMVGCPANTTQIVFFTDDQSFIDEGEDDLENDLCWVIRGTPVHGVAWVDAPNAWEVTGDFRVFAAGVTGDGHTFSVASTLCEAIETRYMLAPDRDIPGDIAAAVKELRRQDGGQLDYAPARRQRLQKENGPLALRKISVPGGRKRKSASRSATMDREP